MSENAMSSVERTLLVAAFSSWCVLVAFGASVHEPWWDEAQSWLIARDAPVAEMFTRHLAYEGHPPVWYLLLAIPAKLGLPYASLQVVAALAAATGVFLLLFRLRAVPLVVRVIAPFSFYLAYQYTVVARSYVLIGALLLAIAAIYEERGRRAGTFVLLVSVLAGVSVHGLALALGLCSLFAFDVAGGTIAVDRTERSRHIALAIAFCAWLAVLLVIVWPPADLSTGGEIHSPVDPRRWATVSGWVIPQLFWGDLSSYAQGAAISVKAVVLSGIGVLLVWLGRRRTAAVFLVLTAAVLAVSAVYYSSWHEGLFFFVLLFSVCVAFGRAAVSGTRLDRVVTALLVVVLLRHVYWTAASLHYDARDNFTGSRLAAAFITERGIDRQRVFGMGVRSFELQPYFAANLFANYDFPGGAFWDWSTGNRWPYPAVDAASRRQMHHWFVKTIAQRPDYVVCAIGFRTDHLYALAMKRTPDYRLMGTFSGRTFWKSEPVELISFQVFERVRPPVTHRPGRRSGSS